MRLRQHKKVVEIAATPAVYRQIGGDYAFLAKSVLRKKEGPKARPDLKNVDSPSEAMHMAVDNSRVASSELKSAIRALRVTVTAMTLAVSADVSGVAEKILNTAGANRAWEFVVAGIGTFVAAEVGLYKTLIKKIYKDRI